MPSTTVSSTTQATTPQGRKTREFARSLRVKLEELDSLHRDRDELVRRVRSLAATDDIQSRILLASSGFERLAAVTPEMFEDVLDDELAKFDKFLVEMTEVTKKQGALLDEIRVGLSEPDRWTNG